MTDEQPRQLGWSILAVLAGIAVNIVAALLIDEVFHALGVYPAQPPMDEPGDNALALSYRVLIAVAGGYVTARLAPSRPMRHVLILGGFGTALSALGVVVASQGNFGPLWYPVALMLATMPCTLLGGKLAIRA